MFEQADRPNVQCMYLFLYLYYLNRYMTVKTNWSEERVALGF